jgi:hypothetical protein
LTDGWCSCQHGAGRALGSDLVSSAWCGAAGVGGGCRWCRRGPVRPEKRKPGRRPWVCTGSPRRRLGGLRVWCWPWWWRGAVVEDGGAAAPLWVVEVLVLASRERWLAGKRCQPAMRGGRSGGSESEVGFRCHVPGRVGSGACFRWRGRWPSRWRSLLVRWHGLSSRLSHGGGGRGLRTKVSPDLVGAGNGDACGRRFPPWGHCRGAPTPLRPSFLGENPNPACRVG